MSLRPKICAISMALLFFSCDGGLIRGPSSQSRGVASPEPLYPVNGQTMSSDRIEYTWQSSPSASRYQFYVREGNGIAAPEKEFKSPLLSASEICTDGICRYSPGFAPGLGHEHQYKVVAMDDSGKSAVSTVHYKVTDSARPARPVNISPKHGETLGLRSGIKFSWTAVSGAFSYDLLVYDRVKHKSVYRESFLGSKDICSDDLCSVTPSVKISPGKDHYFRVIATTYNGQSDANYSAFHIAENSKVGSNEGPRRSGPSQKKLSYFRRED